MDMNPETTNKPYSADMAAYFNKLLRQDHRNRPEAPSQPSSENAPKVQSPPRTDSASPPDQVQTQTSEAPATKPTVAKPPKTKPKKRPRQSLGVRQAKTGRRRGQKPKNVRQTAMVVLIPILAVTLLVLIRKPNGSSAAVAAPSGLDMNKPSIETAPEIEIDWEVPQPYQPAERDPMRSVVLSIAVPDAPVPQKTAPAKLTVRGILYSEDRPAVIIGTHLLHTGDEISGARIVKINRDTVEFQADGRTWEQAVTSANTTDEELDKP